MRQTKTVTCFLTIQVDVAITTEEDFDLDQNVHLLRDAIMEGCDYEINIEEKLVLGPECSIVHAEIKDHELIHCDDVSPI